MNLTGTEWVGLPGVRVAAVMAEPPARSGATLGTSGFLVW
jgi:hypothetical protein